MILCANHTMTGDGKTVREGWAVRVEGGKIAAFGPKAEILQAFPGEEARDFGEATLLPGLCDMHVHLGYYHSQPDGFAYNPYLKAAFAIQHAQAGFARGITSVRDMTSERGLCLGLKTAVEKGFLKLPRITHVDNGMCMTGGHAHEEVAEVDGPWEIRKEIRRQIRDGAEWIKILTTHRTHTPEFTQEELDAAVDECHRRGVKCGVHAGTQPGIQMCIDAGFDTIEHGTFMTQEQAVQMREKGIAWVPTIIAYTYIYEQLRDRAKRETIAGGIDGSALSDFDYFEQAAQAYRQNFKMLADTGVTVLAGTDMVLHGAPVMPVGRELAYMVEYGFSPLRAISAATGDAAAALGLHEQTGTLRSGLCADILVVKGNAAADIAALQQPVQVFRAGAAVL